MKQRPFSEAGQVMKPSGFDKTAYRRRGFVLAVLLIVGAAYIEKWIYLDGDLLRPAAAFLAAFLLIIFSKWKRYLVILTFQMLGALAVMGAVRAIVTGKSVVIPLIALAISMGSLIVMKSDREEQWLSRDDRSVANGLQGLGLKSKPRKQEDDGD